MTCSPSSRAALYSNPLSKGQSCKGLFPLHLFPCPLNALGNINGKFQEANAIAIITVIIIVLDIDYFHIQTNIQFFLLHIILFCAYICATLPRGSFIHTNYSVCEFNFLCLRKCIQFYGEFMNIGNDDNSTVNIKFNSYHYFDIHKFHII